MVSDVWVVFGLVGFRVNKFCSKSWVYLGRKERTGWFPRCAVARVFGRAAVPEIAPGAKRTGFWDETLFPVNSTGVCAGCRALLGLCMVFLVFAVLVPFFVGVEKWFWFSGSFWLSRGKSRGTCPGLGGSFAPGLVFFPAPLSGKWVQLSPSLPPSPQNPPFLFHPKHSPSLTLLSPDLYDRTRGVF